MAPVGRLLNRFGQVARMDHDAVYFGRDVARQVGKLDAVEDGTRSFRRGELSLPLEESRLGTGYRLARGLYQGFGPRTPRAVGLLSIPRPGVNLYARSRGSIDFPSQPSPSREYGRILDLGLKTALFGKTAAEPV